jgi:hypothetical protein
MASLREKVVDRFHKTVVMTSGVRLHYLGKN